MNDLGWQAVGLQIPHFLGKFLGTMKREGYLHLFLILHAVEPLIPLPFSSLPSQQTPEMGFIAFLPMLPHRCPGGLGWETVRIRQVRQDPRTKDGGGILLLLRIIMNMPFIGISGNMEIHVEPQASLRFAASTCSLFITDSLTLFKCIASGNL